VKNGKVERAVPTAEVQKSGTLGTVQFEESGWFLVRAIAAKKETFRFASTAPFYVEVGSAKQRISRASCQFFLDWVDERARRVRLDNPTQRDEVLKYHDSAKQFWQERLSQANAD
jgi:hypothetical protein